MPIVNLILAALAAVCAVVDILSGEMTRGAALIGIALGLSLHARLDRLEEAPDAED